MVLRAPGITRLVAVGGGVVVVVIAAIILLLGPGATGESLLLRVLFGLLLLAGGVTSIARARIALRFDEQGLRAQAAVRARWVVWSEVRVIRVDERTDAHARSVGATPTQQGPIGVSVGSSRRSTRDDGVRLGSPGTKRTVLVSVEGPTPPLQVGIAGRFADEVVATTQAAVDRFAPAVGLEIVGPRRSRLATPDAPEREPVGDVHGDVHGDVRGDALDDDVRGDAPDDDAHAAGTESPTDGAGVAHTDGAATDERAE